MAVDGSILQGEVSENPSAGLLDVEAMLLGFLRALLREAPGQAADSDEGQA